MGHEVYDDSEHRPLQIISTQHSHYILANTHQSHINTGVIFSVRFETQKVYKKANLHEN